MGRPAAGLTAALVTGLVFVRASIAGDRASITPLTTWRSVTARGEERGSLLALAHSPPRDGARGTRTHEQQAYARARAHLGDGARRVARAPGDGRAREALPRRRRLLRLWVEGLAVRLPGKVALDGAAALEGAGWRAVLEGAGSGLALP